VVLDQSITAMSGGDAAKAITCVVSNFAQRLLTVYLLEAGLEKLKHSRINSTMLESQRVCPYTN